MKKAQSNYYVVFLQWLSKKFPNKYYTNLLITTCRIASQEYTFENFTEVEIADFNNEQIATFATNWFKDKAVKPESFLQHLKYHSRTYQLATSPLLLTLLCLTFEESGNFPVNRSELYKEGLDALLKKWDAKRGIQRDIVYKKLSVQRKEDLLGKIALTTFEQGDYFFKQKVAEQYIVDYIRNLPDASTDPEALQLDSERVLKSIEAQHGLLVERARGIYSFSHLTFHEYFTSREIVVVKQSSDEALQNLVERITEKRWREVFLLAVGMSPSADNLLQLMKKHVDALVAADDQLQLFLIWVRQKSLSIVLPYKYVAIRAVYFGGEFDLTLELARKLDNACTDVQVFDLNLDHAGARAHVLDMAAACADIVDLERARALARGFHYNLTFDCTFEPELGQALQELKKQLPDPDRNKVRFKQWWQASSQAWIEQLRFVMIKYRNRGHNLQFSNKQKQLLKQYYDANKLLVECLNSDCYVSVEVRQKIEDELLLPIADIEKRQQQIV